MFLKFIDVCPQWVIIMLRPEGKLHITFARDPLCAYFDDRNSLLHYDHFSTEPIERV